MWELVESKKAEELSQLFAKSLDKLKIALQGEKLSPDEIAEYNSEVYVGKIKDPGAKRKVDSIEIIEALASLKFILGQIERNFSPSKY